MKSLLFWIIGLLLGACLGYACSSFFNIDVYLSTAVGTILGSTAAITINLQREKDPRQPNNLPE